MAKSPNTAAKQADLINPEASAEASAKAEAPAVPTRTAAEIMKPRGWRREMRVGGVTAWRFDDPSGDYFLIDAGGTTDVDPAAAIWTGGRYFDRRDEARLASEIHDAAPLAQIVAEVLALPRLAPLPVFTPIEALRNLVLFHDGDGDFLAANRSLIADMPFGETSFEESLWQVARDICKSAPKEPKS